MNELELTSADKERIKVEIKLMQIMIILFTIALVLLLAVIPLIFFLFGKRFADGWTQRGLFILAGLSLPLIVISWKNMVKYVDLRSGKKLKFETADYSIKGKKDEKILEIRTPLKLKLDLSDDLPPLLKTSEPITIEIAKRSGMLLSITQGGNNLLEEAEKIEATRFSE
ncbi:MAG TPA: hypothetical protein VIU12_26505 [Chryseolinea sp.]